MNRDQSKPARIRRGNIRLIRTGTGETRYKARLRRAGRDESATFTTREAAKRWLTERQRACDLGRVDPDRTATVGVLFDLYRTHVLPEKAGKTQLDQGHALDRWERYLKRETLLTAVTPQRLEAFKERPRERGTGPLSAASVVVHYRLLHHVWRYALRMELAEANPVDRISLPKPRQRVGWLEPDQAQRLLEECRGVSAELHAYIATLLFAGLRRAEGAHLRWGEIDLGDAPALNLLTTKGSRPRTVPVVPELASVLRAWRDRDGIARLPNTWVFPRPGHPEQPYDPRPDFVRARERARLPWMTLHHLRHTTGSWLGQCGANAFTIAAVLGHVDLKTTAIYVHLDDSTRRSALETAIARKGSRPQ